MTASQDQDFGARETRPRQSIYGALRMIVRHVGFFVAITALAWASLAVLGPTKIAPIWPVNGILLAVLLRSPRRRWVMWLGGGYLGIVTGALANGGGAVTSFGLGFMNLIEVGLSASLIRRLAGDRPDLSRLRDVAILGLAAIVSAAVGAIGAGAVLGWLGRADAMYSAVVWTLANGLGQMIGAPVVLALTPLRLPKRFSRTDAALAAFTLAVIAGAAVSVFAQSRYDVLFLLFTPVLMLVFQLEALGAALGVLATALIAVTLTVTGHGPMMRLDDGATERVMMLQVFLLACVVLNFPVAAVLADRRRAQDEVIASEARLKFLSDHARDVVLRLTLDRIIIDVSSSCRHFGYEPKELIGEHGGLLNHPMDRPLIAALFDEIGGGEGGDVGRTREWRVLSKDGAWIQVEGHAAIVRNAAGNPSEFVVVVRDITERKAAEMAIAESEAKYRFLAENSRDLVLQFDAKGTVVYASAAARQFGFEPEEVIGLNSFGMTHPDDVGRVRRAMAAAIDPLLDDHGLLREWRIRNASGDYVWIEGNPSVLRDEQGNMVSFRDTVRDISRRKALEEDLARKRAEAEASDAARRAAEADARTRLQELARLSRVLTVGEFATSIAHELNQPIAAVVTNGEAAIRWLSKDPPDMAEARAAIERGIRDGNRASGIIQRTRAMLAKSPAVLTPLDIQACIEEVLLIADADLRRREISVERDFAEGSPTVVGDYIQLQQVLINLVRNAAEAMSDVGVGVRVLTLSTAVTDAGQVHVSVADTGPGVQADLAKRLFDGFVTTKADGVGLGLPISRSIIEAHGGRLWVEPGGAGATFRFTLQSAGAG